MPTDPTTPQDATEALAWLEREWLDALPPAGHTIVHGIFQRLPSALAADGWSVMRTEDMKRLRAAALDLCRFAGRFSAGDIDVERGDVQVAIDEVRAALGDPS